METKTPKFLRTLYYVLHNEPSDILAWSSCGSHFQVYDVARLETEVLPRYFKHNKFVSFQRQLNNFGFRKWTKTRASVCTFSHDVLVQCPPSELPQFVSEFGIVSPHMKSAGKRSRSSSSSSNSSSTSASSFDSTSHSNATDVDTTDDEDATEAKRCKPLQIRGATVVDPRSNNFDLFDLEELLRELPLEELALSDELLVDEEVILSSDQVMWGDDESEYEQFPLVTVEMESESESESESECKVLGSDDWDLLLHLLEPSESL
jgi:hypothetical protein